MRTGLRVLTQQRLSNLLISWEFFWSRMKFGLVGLRAHRNVSIYSTAKIYQPYKVVMGEHASIGDYCVLWGGGGIEIGSGAMISTNCALVSLSHDADAVAMGFEYRETSIRRPIKIGANVWIGANVTILPGVTIGDNSIIGAGSTVARDIPADVVAYGSPASVKRSLARSSQQA